MRALIRTELFYTPQVLREMTMEELAQAYNDIQFVRDLETKNNGKKQG